MDLLECIAEHFITASEIARYIYNDEGREKLKGSLIKHRVFIRDKFEDCLFHEYRSELRNVLMNRKLNY